MNSLQTRKMLNKVPEVTIYFWIIKILCTTIGETAADYLNETLNFGLTGTSIVMSSLLVILLIYQFKARRHIPSIYWTAVVFISVVGTLITDNLTDNLGVPLETSSIVLALALFLTFAVWYAVERTLSIHTIFTLRREAFYWLAVLFTFSLGTAAGDLMAERYGVGYLASVFIFGTLIAMITLVHFVVKAILVAEHKRQSSNAVLAFWIAYILTRPLGASIGDYLSQASAHGGVGLGPAITSALFSVVILGLVIYLSFTRVDETFPEIAPAHPMNRPDLEAQAGLR
jgi:uncharacterized membrane-anchored protein